MKAVATLLLPWLPGETIFDIGGDAHHGHAQQFDQPATS